jgi:DNA-binding MarR family transcriptional regulator
MAALDRAPDGHDARRVSRRMMVSNGNVTGLAARLEAEGWSSAASPGDRRAQLLRLTAEGRANSRAIGGA